MISYEEFWNTLKKKNISQYKLIHDYNVSAGQLSRMRANAHISTHTLDTLCSILNCKIENIITFLPDEDIKNR